MPLFIALFSLVTALGHASQTKTDSVRYVREQTPDMSDDQFAAIGKKSLHFLILKDDQTAYGTMTPETPSTDLGSLQQAAKKSRSPAVQSAFLQTPELAIDYVEDMVSFWDVAVDPVYGGYWRGVAEDGTITDTKKEIMVHSRHAYAFTKAFQLTGDDVYLAKAHDAMNQVYAHGWDPVYGGWFVTFTEDWKRTGRTNKPSFFQDYTILGMRALLEVHPNDVDRGWWQTSLDLINNKMWDDRPDFEGPFKTADRDWGRARLKGFTPSVDGITTHRLADYLLTGDADCWSWPTTSSTTWWRRWTTRSYCSVFPKTTPTTGRSVPTAGTSTSDLLISTNRLTINP